MGGIIENTPNYDYPRFTDPRQEKLESYTKEVYKDEVKPPIHVYPYKPSLGDKIEELMEEVKLGKFSPEMTAIKLFEILSQEGISTEMIKNISGRTGRAIAELLRMSGIDIGNNTAN